MPNAKLKNYAHLHFIIFILGFTAVLGKLTSIAAFPLVWYRMAIASALVLLFLVIGKKRLRVSKKVLKWVVAAGILIALHWFTFFKAIKISNVSVTLATLSSGAFFTAILEPIWYRRKVVWYEIVFGICVVVGLYIIFSVERQYAAGMGLALLSALLMAIFSLINGKLIQKERATIISFYELGVGALFLTGIGFLVGDFNRSFFEVSMKDWIFIGILASFCTAYAFIASIHVMRYLSPFTVMLSINLEPVYGILLAFFILGEHENMTPGFFFGGVIILLTVIANGILKSKLKLKK